MPERGDNAVYKIARAALALEQFEFEEKAHALMGAPTLNVGTVTGGININSVPDAAEIGIDIRSVAGQDHANVLRCLCRVLGDTITLAPRLDVASIYYRFAANPLTDDYYGYAARGLVARANTPAALAATLRDYARHKPADLYRRAAYYNATLGTPDEGHSRERTASPTDPPSSPTPTSSLTSPSPNAPAPNGMDSR